MEDRYTSRLDRPLQLRILRHLAAKYPAIAQPKDEGLNFAQDDPAWTFNIRYLAEHGLVEAKLSEFLGGGAPFVAMARITARGIDFIEDDGGLSAILGVVTVRIEAESLKQLLAAKVDASSLPAEEKSALKTKLRELGSDALKEVTKRLLDAALDHWPDAIRTAQTLLG